MKLRKKIILLFVISFCLIMTGCQNFKGTSSNNNPIMFFEISGGLDGNGTQVLEWGENHEFNNDVYFKIGDGVESSEVMISYKYNSDNVGNIQKMKIVAEYRGKEYKETYPILIDDTKAPEIKYVGETKMSINKEYNILENIKVTDMKGDVKEEIFNCDQLSKFYKGYIVVYVLADDEVGYEEALQANMANQLNNESAGKYKMIIRASDGHGNITDHVEDLELVDELIYQ